MTNKFDFPINIELFIENVNKQIPGLHYHISCTYHEKYGFSGIIEIYKKMILWHVQVTFEFINDAGIDVVGHTVNEINKYQDKANEANS